MSLLRDRMFRSSEDGFLAPPPEPALLDAPREEVNQLSAPEDPFMDLKFRIHEKLIKELDPTRTAGRDSQSLRPEVEEVAKSLLNEEDVPIARQERARLITEIADEVLGLGPLEPLLNDASITEVMVNSPNQVFFERAGVLHLSDRVFRNTDHILQMIEKIISPLNRRIDDSSPMVDARLPDGSRVNAVIPPASLDSPSITIRKFSRDPITIEDLVNYGTVTDEIVEFLRAAVQVRLNIVISGGTGSGKTTLLNVLSSFIPNTERIITIEDPAELQLRQRNLVRMETRPANIEGRGQIAQRELVRNALRMRPDRIIIGEVRSGEAFDMLQAMNTGHDGSLTTVHANTPRDALARIENMVLMAGLELPVRAIREQMSSAVNLIVHISRMRDGSRRITHISEVAGMEGQVITMQDLFAYHQTGIDGQGRVIGKFRAAGIRPKCTELLEQSGIFLAASVFANDGGTWE